MSAGDGRRRAKRTPPLLLLAHGSPDRDAHAELLDLRTRVATRTGREVSIGVLEFPTAELPPLGELFTAAAPGGRIAAQPLVLFEGRHGQRDIPAVVATNAQRCRITVALGTALGLDPALVDLAVTQVRAASPSPADVLLFIGRGSSEPRALRETERVARTIGERVGIHHTVCYTGISRPTLAEGMAAVLARRPRRVIALPYLLHTGVLLQRVPGTLIPIAQQAGAELVILPHLGASPELVRLVSARVEALA